jgi:FixJ family two-component response regulator
MDGVGLARALRQRQPDLPVVLVTGFASSVTELEFAVLRKPFDVSDLSKVIAKAIAEAQTVNADNVIRLRDRRGTAERQLSPEARDQSQRDGPGRGDDGPGNVPA